MAKEGRHSVEETIIEEALSEKELEGLLVGFLEALEREQRQGYVPKKKAQEPKEESAVNENPFASRSSRSHG